MFFGDRMAKLRHQKIPSYVHNKKSLVLRDEKRSSIYKTDDDDDDDGHEGDGHDDAERQ